MRDRLIELLKGAETKVNETLSVALELDEWLGIYADHLIANGVIVPPCKVGDTVYQVTRDFISEFRVRFIEISTCGNLFLHTDLISGIIHTGEIFPESEIGKTVFLTREEAEAKLKEGVSNA